MTSNLEQRLYRLEAQIAAIQQQIAAILAQLAALAQKQYGNGGQGGDGSSGGYFGCITSADCPAGSPGAPATGQTVWILNGGTRSSVTETAKVYNDTPNDVPSGSQVMLAGNGDGTFTIIGVVCS